MCDMGISTINEQFKKERKRKNKFIKLGNTTKVRLLVGKESI